MKKNTMIILTASLGLAAAPGAWAQVVLSDNLASTSGGRSVNLDTGWSAARFITDAQTYKFTSAVLLMSGIASPVAQVDVYSDSRANRPGAPLGTLISPGAFSTSLEQKTFTSAGIPLAANSAYWVVLKATSGGLGWSYTYDPNGTGVGFSGGSSDTLDAGVTWNSSQSPSYQMQVNVDAIPEPGQWAMMGMTLAGVGGWVVRQRRAKAKVG